MSRAALLLAAALVPAMPAPAQAADQRTGYWWYQAPPGPADDEADPDALMKPAILVALLFRTLDAFRIFDNIYVLTGGTNNTGSVSILGYDNLFKAFNIGLGSAISVLIFATVAIIAFIYIKIFGAAAPGAEAEVR